MATAADVRTHSEQARILVQLALEDIATGNGDGDLSALYAEVELLAGSDAADVAEVAGQLAVMAVVTAVEACRTHDDGPFAGDVIGQMLIEHAAIDAALDGDENEGPQHNG